MSFDVMAALAKWSRARLGVDGYVIVPSERPSEFATFERTGGTSELGVDRPNVAVQLWSESEYGAYTLALLARDALLLHLAEDVPEVCRAEVGGIYRFPDPDSRTERYQLDLYLVTRM